MLIHPWDSVEDWRTLVRGNDFGQLFTAGHVDGCRASVARIRIEPVKAKQKYGGNKSDDQRRDIADRLAARNVPGDTAVLRHLPRDGKS
ncbi:MAG: hypothetical protein L0H93_11710 [Nocardioides sp.]|nr:hypothetical protein [Nocardioides sp.]